MAGPFRAFEFTAVYLVLNYLSQYSDYKKDSTKLDVTEYRNPINEFCY
jgi:hypothetical protein